MTSFPYETEGRFRFDGWADPDHSVYRDETKDLIALVKNGSRIYIDGARRNGKTTLVLNSMAEARIPTLRIDLEGVASTEKFIERVESSANKFLDAYPAVRKKLTSGSKAKGNAGLNFWFIKGGVEYERSMDGKTIGHSIDSLLDVVRKVAEEAGAVVFVDEFQTVKDPRLKNPGEIMGSFASISDPAQTRQQVSFVFAGSNRHAMHQIFAGSESLFFQRTQNISLGPIPEEQIIPFLNERFGGEVPESVSHEAYRWTEGIPGDLQRLYSALRRGVREGDAVEPRDLHHAKNVVVEDLGRSYQLTLQTLDVDQLQLLDIVAKGGIRSVQELNVAAKARNIHPEALKKAMNHILCTGLLHVSGIEHKISRPEPILFHYLAANPAMEHRPSGHILPASQVLKNMHGGSPSNEPDVGG